MSELKIVEHVLDNTKANVESKYIHTPWLYILKGSY